MHLWQNQIASVGGGVHMIYSEGTITDTELPGWFTPNYSGTPNFLCDNSLPARNLAVRSGLWNNTGASGSPVLSKSTHRILLGPTSIGSVDAVGRNQMSIIDYLYWGFVNSDYATASCPGSNPGVNATLLNNLGLAGPSSYYGWADKDLDGLFDVHADLEKILGENRRDWYWLAFNSPRRNALWDVDPEFATIKSTAAFGRGGVVVDTREATSSFVRPLSHEMLNLTPGKGYVLTFLTYVWENGASSNQPLNAGLETGWWTFRAGWDPPVGVWSRHTARFRPESQYETLYFSVQDNMHLLLADVSLIEEDAVSDFDTHDKRSTWFNPDTRHRALIWPNGKTDVPSPDWAGVVQRRPSFSQTVDWSLANANLGLYSGQYRICFDVKVAPPTFLGGGMLGIVRVVDPDGEVPGTRTYFQIPSSWTEICMPLVQVENSDCTIEFGIQGSWFSIGTYLVDDIQIERQ